MANSNIETSILEETSRLEIAAAAGVLPALDIVQMSGEELWRSEASPDQLDDRRLYWRRLAMLEAMQNQGADAETVHIQERASRGITDNPFSQDCRYRILVTGFDPFHLDDHIEQGNPSGVIALQLNGARFEIANDIAEVRTMIFPVRYRDFDDEVVERALEPLLNSVDMVVTVSMGRTGFDLERFPGLRRSVTTLDNERLHGGGSMTEPVVPPGLKGPEFVEFTLPVAEMCAASGDFQVNDNRLVTTLERGEFEASSLDTLGGDTVVMGSGGGYLSNEISYRVLTLLERNRKKIPAGHIHTPRMQGYDAEFVRRVSTECRRLIEAGISSIGS